MIDRPTLGSQGPAATALLAVCSAPECDHSAKFAALAAEEWSELVQLALRTRTAGLVARSIEQNGISSLPVEEALGTLTQEVRLIRLTALAQGQACARTIQILQQHGLEPIALKGLSLAFRDYPDPSLRPLRDVDLLLAPQDSLKAQKMLLEHPSFKQRGGVAQYGLEYSHQLPEIEEIASGLVIELHHRINARGWDQEPHLITKLKDEAQPLTLLGKQISVPSPHANFLHLIEHATLHHLFSNGPLILSDLHYLASNQAVDWERLKEEAESMGLARALWLVASTAAGSGARWVPKCLLSNAKVQPEMLNYARKAMFETREQAEQIAMIGRVSKHPDGKIGDGLAASRVLRPSANQLSRLSGHPSDSNLRWFGYPAWLIEKGQRYLAARSSGELAVVSRERSQLNQWIKGQ